MPEVLALVPSAEVIERLLTELRRRLELAVEQKQKVRVHVHAGMKRQVWQPGVSVVPEEDGSFDFHLYIEPKC